ncbi:MAG: Asp-tRNA(Asn)/Glu-tRNA(Gln) amidotransferase subunit GatC [Planctomycetes bacterium]|nr:Asp-tRNA(Asn)/Glu-tRNA(Gln) amidotransferase subunit GatC [Planctomycetota bacterium]MCC7170266.1 Asp-tRNA(Asn)/Glu-tRNA(Gln) amidotransferase subunit GatC [Planctomycetota bacterium]
MDRATVDKVARLARLELTDAQRDQYAVQLSAILAHFESLRALDTTGIEPSVYAVDLTGRPRPDEPGATAGHDALIANATAHREGFFVVPRVIE